MKLVDAQGIETPRPKQAPAADSHTVRRAQPRGGFVTVRLFPRPTERMKGGLYLPTETMGTAFEQGIIVDVGRGVLLDSGAYGGTDDLKPGQRVLVKVGERIPARGALGGQQLQLVQSVITLEVEGEENLILTNHQDIYAILD
jgi:hypothetical protein